MWLLVLFACEDGDGARLALVPDSTGAVDTGVALSWVESDVEVRSARYVLDLDWDGATWDGDAYVFVTDLGYTVGLQAATLTTSSLELVPCDALELSFVFVPDAQLAHSGHEHDISQIVVDRGIDLFGDMPIELGSAETGDTPYCVTYELLSLASDTYRVATLEGWYQLGSAPRTSFAASSSVPATALRTLVVLDDARPSGAATVRLTRFPARSLDGIELATVGDIDLAFDFSVQLAQTTRVSVHP